MSVFPEVDVNDDVAKFNNVPVKIYVNGYIWPLSYDEDKTSERVDQTSSKPDDIPPLFHPGRSKVIVNPSNPIKFGDFRGDNMRTLNPTPTKNFIQYRLSVLEEFCPIELIGKAVFISPDELYDKFGIKSNTAIVVLWTNPDKATIESSKSLLINWVRLNFPTYSIAF